MHVIATKCLVFLLEIARRNMLAVGTAPFYIFNKSKRLRLLHHLDPSHHVTSVDVVAVVLLFDSCRWFSADFESFLERVGHSVIYDL
jgi:hypothetical protein